MKHKGTMSNNSNTLKSLTERSTQDIETWLDSVSIGGEVEEEPFNWQLFAFSIASQATDERSPRKARIAIRVYEGLAAREMDPDPFSLMYSAMNLRAWMIRELGVREGHEVLDPQPIVDWVKRVTTLPIEVARQFLSTGDIKTIPTEQLRRLREIKNALAPLTLVPESSILPKHPELTEWLQIRPALP
jgi:hypothetical protein